MKDALRESWPEQLKEFTSILSEVKESRNAWELVQEIIETKIGAKLFTVLIHMPSEGIVSRIHTSDPLNYPVGGTKKMGPTPWGELVLQRGESFLATSDDDIRWAFPDYEKIFSLGLGSALNAPMLLFGETVGTLNLLHRRGFYSTEHLRKLEMIAAALPSLCFAGLEKGNIENDIRKITLP